MRRSLARPGVWFVVAALTVGCGDGGTEPPPPPPPPPPKAPPVSRIEVSPADTTVEVESDFAVTITAYDSAGKVLTGRQLAVTSDRADVASAIIPQGGTLTQIAVSANALGTAEIMVTAPNTGTGTAVSTTAQVHVRPKVVRLTLPAGYTYTEVFDVNDARIVVGQAGSPPRAWAYSPTKGTRLLPVLSQTQWISQARGVNTAGVIVGYAYDSTTDAHLVTWDAQDQLTDRGMLGYSLSIGTAINTSGQIALYRDVTTPEYGNAPALYEGPGQVTDLGTGAGEPTSIADDGAIVGGIRKPGDILRAFLWTRAEGLRTFAPSQNAPSSHAALGVATGARVAGWYATGVGLTIHGFYWSPSDGWHDIGPLTGYTESVAAAIDESGQIVGYSMGTLGYRAFLWTKSGGLVDLGAGVEGWSKATAISPGGVVAGTVDLGSGTGPTLPVLWITRRLP